MMEMWRNAKGVCVRCACVLLDSVPFGVTIIFAKAWEHSNDAPHKRPMPQPAERAKNQETCTYTLCFVYAFSCLRFGFGCWLFHVDVAFFAPSLFLGSRKIINSFAMSEVNSRWKHKMLVFAFCKNKYECMIWERIYMYECICLIKVFTLKTHKLDI